ncbi:MAG: NupC/NupG family nucleoside CNT transporter [Lysobacteraceae bacterium]
MTDILFGFIGLASLLAIALLFSENRRGVDWRLVATGVGLQLVFAVFVLLTPWGTAVFGWLSRMFVRLLGYTAEGSRFIFGELVNTESIGFVFAFQVLPTIIFFAAFMSVLYHLGVMQWIVRGMAWVITKVMRVSGAETLSVCANAFIGQTEAPLVVKPYILGMTRSELLTLMVGGMATIAGGVLGAYVMLLGGNDPVQQAFYAQHLIAASIMAAPATLVIAKILVPETGEPETRGIVRVEVEKTTANVIDAAASGAAEGLRLALNVGAMLLAFIALVALLNGPLEWIGGLTGINDRLGQPLSLSLLLGYVVAPVAWLVGVPAADTVAVGGLIGTKVVLNEFVAYVQLAEIQDGLSDKGRLIATYALCGFANISSIAIQIGGIGGLAPQRRADLARFGLKAVLGGSLATLMTATIAGVLGSF